MYFHASINEQCDYDKMSLKQTKCFISHFFFHFTILLKIKLIKKKWWAICLQKRRIRIWRIATLANSYYGVWESKEFSVKVKRLYTVLDWWALTSTNWNRMRIQLSSKMSIISTKMLSCHYTRISERHRRKIHFTSSRLLASIISKNNKHWSSTFDIFKHIIHCINTCQGRWYKCLSIHIWACQSHCNIRQTTEYSGRSSYYWASTCQCLFGSASTFKSSNYSSQLYAICV